MAFRWAALKLTLSASFLATFSHEAAAPSQSPPLFKNGTTTHPTTIQSTSRGGNSMHSADQMSSHLTLLSSSSSMSMMIAVSIPTAASTSRPLQESSSQVPKWLSTGLQGISTSSPSSPSPISMNNTITHNVSTGCPAGCTRDNGELTIWAWRSFTYETTVTVATVVTIVERSTNHTIVTTMTNSGLNDTLHHKTAMAGTGTKTGKVTAEWINDGSLTIPV